MAKKYRVELKPLEPYFFAGEKSFGFGKKKKQSYNNYFIRSELFPTQTTLLGTIRYLILKKYNLLTTKDYSNEKEQEKYVGKSSFQIGQKNQSYGMIERLSPLFILNEKGERLVRVPFNPFLLSLPVFPGRIPHSFPSEVHGIPDILFSGVQ